MQKLIKTKSRVKIQLFLFPNVATTFDLFKIETSNLALNVHLNELNIAEI